MLEIPVTERKPLRHFNIDNRNDTFTYGKVMSDFVDIITEKVFKQSMNGLVDPFKFVNINTRIPSKKRLMKTRIAQGYVQKPILSINGSIYTDEDGEGMFPGYFFNTDMSSMGFQPEEYGSVCLKGDNRIDRYNAKLIIVPKRATLNVEMNIISDFIQKLDNIKIAWNKIRFKDHKYTEQIEVFNIIPYNTVMNMAYEYKMFSTPEDLKGLSYRDIYEFLRKYVTPEYTLYYMWDGSVGRYEIVISYTDTLLIKPDIMTIAGGNKSGTIDRDNVLFRNFFVEFNIVSMYFIKSKTHIDFGGAQELLTFDKEKGMVSSLSAMAKQLEKTTGIAVKKIEPVSNMLEGKSEVCSASYTHNTKDDISLYVIMDKAIVDYHKLLERNGIKSETYFYILIKNDLGDEIDIEVDYSTLTIPWDGLCYNKDYKIYIYLDLAEYQRYKLKEDGYAKLK